MHTDVSPAVILLHHTVVENCKLADTVIRGLLKYWPITNSSKEVMFLGELERSLDATQPAEFQNVCTLVSPNKTLLEHFHISREALFLWNSDHIQNLIKQNNKVILPIVLLLWSKMHGTTGTKPSEA
ncbi:hypothetical protein KIW84_UN0752 [Lathyrus oleraceus]|nr:hypothetical protein KIW84_UN0752 [Pisum sativum]